jgi:hypothetical protein
VLMFCWAGSASAALMAPVAVNGNEWLQPADFIGLSWNDIFAVCGAGPCMGDLTVPYRGTYEMDGWTWASNEQVQSLFNTFTGRNDTAPAEFVEAYSAWAPAVLAVFNFTISGFGLDTVAGWSSSLDARGRGYTPFVRDDNGDGPGSLGNDALSTRQTSFVFQSFESEGGWFVRDAQQVPIPPTIPLLGVGLAALGYSRRKRVKS